MTAIKIAANIVGQFAQTRENVRTDCMFPLSGVADLLDKPGAEGIQQQIGRRMKQQAEGIGPRTGAGAATAQSKRERPSTSRMPRAQSGRYSNSSVV